MTGVHQAKQQCISEVTRRNIADFLTINHICWSGRLREVEFLSRLYDLSSLPSTDYRFGTAYGDIEQHRERNWDWSNDYIFTDARFNLLRGPDEEFLRFLCEMLHPVVQPESRQVDELVEIFNQQIAADGWEIAPCRNFQADQCLLHGGY